MKVSKPLVSILIPTHNRLEYFKLALKSALMQTYSNIEIVISDDSDNYDTYNYIQPFLQDKRIKYNYNSSFTSTENWLWLIDNCQGEYFNYLMDDDLFYPKKIEEMVRIYEKYSQVSLVTSKRDLINGAGNILPDQVYTKPIIGQDAIIDGKYIMADILSNTVNFIGEPTSVLVKREYLADFRRIILEKWGNIGDIRVWLILLEHGDLFYLTEPLSAFRVHDSNMQLTNLNYTYMKWIELLYEYGHNADNWNKETVISIKQNSLIFLQAIAQSIAKSLPHGELEDNILDIWFKAMEYNKKLLS